MLKDGRPLIPNAAKSASKMRRKPQSVVEHQERRRSDRRADHLGEFQTVLKPRAARPAQEETRMSVPIDQEPLALLAHGVPLDHLHSGLHYLLNCSATCSVMPAPQGGNPGLLLHTNSCHTLQDAPLTSANSAAAHLPRHLEKQATHKHGEACAAIGHRPLLTIARLSRKNRCNFTPDRLCHYLSWMRARQHTPDISGAKWCSKSHRRPKLPARRSLPTTSSRHRRRVLEVREPLPSPLSPSKPLELNWDAVWTHLAKSPGRKDSVGQGVCPLADTPASSASTASREQYSALEHAGDIPHDSGTQPDQHTLLRTSHSIASSVE